MADSVEGKVMLLVGGLGFLGRAVANDLAGRGARVAVADLESQLSGEHAGALRATHGSAVSLHPVDIGSESSVRGLLDELRAGEGRIDGVLSTAYPRNERYGARLFDVRYDDFCENVSLHLGGYFLVAQQTVRTFLDQGHGSLVNVGSIYGVVAPRFEVYADTAMTMPVEYAAIKSGILHLTRYFAAYLKGSGSDVRVNAVSPGGLLDGQDERFLARYRDHCVGKGMLDREDVTGAIRFLLSDDSRFVNGQNLVVDDGFAI